MFMKVWCQLFEYLLNLCLTMCNFILIYRHLDPSSKDKSAVASFSLPEEPVSICIPRQQGSDKAMLLASVTQNGHLLIFEHVLNG
jgi:hypothetical protein